ncbi:ATP-binding cassette domain-containing protein [Microbacterium lacus]|uniref:ABC transporter ATP-binding protein n=1 Tax=Microbacterium lacus TaxID=415217 RepID=UPI00384A68DA
MSGARVQAQGWGWRHAGRRRWAVAGLDLDLAPGERVLLLGASGSGKSTLLRGLAGVLGDAEDGEQAGSLLIDGTPPAGARGRSGLVLQDPDAQVILARVGDDIAFAGENLGIAREEIWRRVDAAIDAVGLPFGRDHSTAKLSGGQQQRLALAGVLAMQPGLLLLDEPTANLDPEGAVSVRDAVLRATASTGATLVVVEHRVSLWADHVDRVIVLGSEGLLAEGSPDAVFRDHGAALTAAGVWVPGASTGFSPAARGGQGSVLLEARDLAVGRKPFGEKTARVAASGISFDVTGARALAITGANGTGKSTLAMTAAGLLAPVEGSLAATEALRAGLGAEPLAWRSRDLLTRVGTVFQAPEHQLLTTRVRDELEVGPKALRLSDAERVVRVDELLERLRLTHLAAVNPFTLSGGEKRRLTVAATLATRPRVIVLDEPTYGQDARTWRELAGLIDEVRAAGTAVAFVSHDRALVDALADDELVLGGVA